MNRIETEGTVLGYEERSERIVVDGKAQPKPVYHLKLEVMTKDGQKITIVDPEGRDDALFEVGRKVPLNYDPKDLQSAKVGSYEDYSASVILAIFGAIVLFSGIVGFAALKDQKTTFSSNFESEMNHARLVVMGRGVLVSGTVREIKEVSDSDPLQYAIVCVPDGSDSKQTYESIVQMKPPLGTVGRRVKIYVDPTDAQRYYVDVIELLRGSSARS